MVPQCRIGVKGMWTFGHIRRLPWTGVAYRRSSPNWITTSRLITVRAARELLGFDQTSPIQVKQLRAAYFAAAKQCHPDARTSSSNSADDFLQLTAAYEVLLQQETTVTFTEAVSVVGYEEEQAFRAACELQLGVDAEIVEECKQSPEFRHWLTGRTDAAHTWRDFFRQNGGLAPKLQSFVKLPAGEHAPPAFVRRTRRR